jgi:CheY-like chemotaxis protein
MSEPLSAAMAIETVLVIDDEVIARVVISEYLRQGDIILAGSHARAAAAAGELCLARDPASFYEPGLSAKLLPAIPREITLMTVRRPEEEKAMAQLKGAALLAELAKHEDDHREIAKALAPGCKYNNTSETETATNDNGHKVVRHRTCREVFGCNDPAHNIQRSCEPWSDWQTV